MTTNNSKINSSNLIKKVKNYNEFSKKELSNETKEIAHL